ncbi:MAG: Ribosomal large subunit pseudouridine synthase A (EC [uncultured Thiotrichaceae bacterium]|uniref:Dual-specificity RNA pseudouridine synthase RluA n=1 Tax=uncultured Thiotrichaceae bacterium TaxID=298394 RepID=A0A6S6SYY8_9GAMM|nr:MAG: Ribosomal large subunit pseudouridine synthase A (EC [uncultured Thiotrichaceae bacterium]
MSMPYVAPPDNGLDLVYLDEALLIVNKPAGLLSVPGRGEDKQDCLISRVQREYPEVLSVHRLDMSTSGLMILARSKALEREMSILFQQRQVHKRYTAVVTGRPEPESGEIDLPLITDWPNRPRQKVDHDIGKPSLTRYRVSGFDPVQHSSRMELEPVTGRSHQLRVHLMALGHAILGDELYATAEVHAQSERLLLHAMSLRFAHPLSGDTLSIESSVPF